MSSERSNPELLLTTTEVGELMEVHPSTVKRWCNEEGLPFGKTDGGHRRIHLLDALEFGREKQVSTFLDSFAPYEGHVWAALQEILSAGEATKAISLSMGWLYHGHTERVGALLRAFGKHPEVRYGVLFDGLIFGFMREVGEAWASGRIGVAGEHLASQVIIEALLGLRRDDAWRLPVDAPVRPVAVVGAMEGDQHHIGSLCIRLTLENAGWQVAYLGPDVPVEEFSATQRNRGASLVCISLSPPHTNADAMRAIRIMAEFYRADCPHAVAVGGSAVTIKAEAISDTTPFPALGLFQTTTEFLNWVDTLEAGTSAPTVDGENGWAR